MTMRACCSLALLLTAIPALAESDLSAESMSANGVQVRKLTCKLQDANPFALLVVVGALGNEKKALDACSPGGAAFEVQWTARGGKLEDVKVVRGTAKGKDACVRKALKGVTSPLSGSCSGYVLVGDAGGAEKAAASLLPAAAPAP